MSAVSCQQLTKKFGRLKALNEMSFEIEPNTITGLIGRNGAGKTSLLKMIAGYWKPYSGQLHVFGKQPFNNLEASANCIMIDDRMQFPSTLSLAEILKWGKMFYPNWDARLAERLLDYFQLPSHWRHDELSKGKRSTFNMIIGLSSRCPLTLLDEPATGMDPAARSDFYRALLKDYIAHPRTILLSSHHFDEVEHLLENVLLIDEGACKLHMPVEELKSYAVAVEGEEVLLRNGTAGCEVLSEHHNNFGELKRVIRCKSLSAEAMEKLKKKGFRLTSVSPSEVCMLITNDRNGGIDSVFESGINAE